MKKILYVWFVSILGILLGGLLLCVPQIIPFAITLLVLSGVLFVFTGFLSILEYVGCLDD